MNKPKPYPKLPEVLYGKDEQPEVVIDHNLDLDVPEIKVRYNKSTKKRFYGKADSSWDTAKFLRKTIPQHEIELREYFIVLFLDRSNNILGYYKTSIGGVNGTVVDPRLVLGIALNCVASSFILCHNHPSGNLKPSDADHKLTRKLVTAAKYHELHCLDHIILTTTNYYSFADEGVMPTAPTLNGPNSSINELRVVMKYNEHGAQWEETSMEQAINDLEGAGYWKQGTTEKMLREGHELWTPWASYKMWKPGTELEGIGDEADEEETLMNEARLEIKRHLDKLTPDATPVIHSQITTKEGYEKIEKMVLDLMLKDKITPGPAIAQLESELS